VFWLIYFLLLIALIHLYFMFSRRFGILDLPVDRSSHAKPVIRGAGILFPAGLGLWFVWSGFQYPWFFTGLLALSLISFLDDLSHMMRWVRFLTQLLVLPFIYLQLGCPEISWWALAIAGFLALGIINAFNFMDGINGMMGMYSLGTLATLWFVNNHTFRFIGNEILYVAAIPLLVFGFYNFRTRARCFAGDVGPVAISLLFVFLFSKLILDSGNVLYLCFLLLFGIDCSMTILCRIRLGENIVKPHRKHLYQILANEGGFSQIKIAAGYVAIQLAVNSLILVLIAYASACTAMVVAGILIAGALASYLVLKAKSDPKPAS